MKVTFLAPLIMICSIGYISSINAQNVLPTTGNVGIGTTTPETNLDVKGCSKLDTVIIRETFTADKATTLRDSVTIQKTLKIEENIEVIGDANFYGAFKLYNLANTSTTLNSLMIVKPNGQVGSIEKGGLQNLVYEPLDPVIACFTDENGNLPAPIWSNIQDNIGGPGVLYTGLNCGAKVGINTNTPVSSLEVIGTVQFSGNTAIGASIDVNNRLSVGQNAPNSNGLVINHTGGVGAGVGVRINMTNTEKKAFAVNENLEDKFVVMNNGSLTINKIPDNSKAIAVFDGTYDVFRVYGNGVVFAQEYNARLKQDFPDYVFNADYTLMTLEELRSFIENNNKLPKLPAANDVAQNGMNIAEINVLLVEKIEELTLYILQLENRIKVLETK
jgi:hypothetical protein